MRSLRSALLLLALLLALPHQMATAGQGPDEVLLLDLCLNDRCFGVAVVAMRQGRVLIDREALVAAGLDPTGLEPERIGDHLLVDPGALDQGVEARIDHSQLRVDLHQAAQDKKLQRVNLRARPPTDPVGMPWSASLNYAAGVATHRGNRGAGPESLFLDGAAGRGHAALRSTGHWSETEGWRRGLTRFEYDDLPGLRRWTAGDQFAIARDPLGGGVLLGGVGVERAYDQDPYLVTFPQPFYSGLMEAPGTVEVYANGAMIARHELGAGPFSLDNLGIPQGRSDLQIIVRDPFGGRSELAGVSFYGASSLLAPGLSDYAFRVGRPRVDGGFGNRGYADRTAGQAWYRRGLTSWLTVGGRVEADRDVRNVGADLALVLPRGELGLALAASDDDTGGGGGAASLLYSYSSGVFGFGMGTRRFDRDYRRLGEQWGTGSDSLLASRRLREDDFIGLSWSPVGGLAVQVNAGRQRRETQETERTVGASVMWRVARRSQLLFSLQRHTGGWREEGETSAVFSYSHSFDRDTFNADVRRRGGHTGYGIGARRTRFSEVGWGYDLNLQQFDGYDSGTGHLEYQGHHGRYSLQADHFGGRTTGRLMASGALVAIGGQLHATPPLETGYALVRVPDIGGVPVMRENQMAGHTGARGDLLVRGLVPFYANRLSIDHHAVPLDHDIRVGERDVAVPRNTGALVLMDVRALRAATGHVHLRNGATLEPVRHGLLRLRGGEATLEAPLGGSGRFYVEEVVAGRYEATVERDGELLAECVLQVPAEREAGIADLGVLECESVEGRP